MQVIFCSLFAFSGPILYQKMLHSQQDLIPASYSPFLVTIFYQERFITPYEPFTALNLLFPGPILCPKLVWVPKRLFSAPKLLFLGHVLYKRGLLPYISHFYCVSAFLWPLSLSKMACFSV